MADFSLADPKGWEYDLHSVYSAYIGHFQLHNIPWYERSWGHLFSTFEEFLAFSWPVIVVTDVDTGKAHVVTRFNSIGAFLKMIKTRFGESLPEASNIQIVKPFETSQRRLHHVSDYTTYRKLHQTLPAHVLSAQKQRIRSGDPQAIRELWEKKDKTFLAIDFEWNERNDRTCLEWGYAAVRCGHLEAAGHWPPVPDTNYRKGHFIISEYVDKIVNKHCPTYPYAYAFGESQIISKTKLPQIIGTVISSFASPDSETLANTLVLVAHGVSGDLARLEEMKIKIPHNMFIIDTAVFERNLVSQGLRKVVRQPGSTLSLENLLRTFALTPSPDGRSTPLMLPNVTMHNAGNDALLTLFSLQFLLDPNGTHPPTPKRMVSNRMAGPPLMHMTLPTQFMVPQVFHGALPIAHTGSLPATPLTPSRAEYDLANEFGQMRIQNRSGSRSPGKILTPDGRNGVNDGRRLSGFDWQGGDK
ncbi:hypothetical protein Moror_9099 [Moniliophthora roreri MCA 2997]|uniref:Gfd2/YDR514C-like C-terminal domain-containing protein n=1 Tax=Moniliophthora roreri (strain MCA 2997) TaxID=1381753 RepID=V2X150_MONRO|nr:hypothetical protein Moror_9099 [Moniliophthora roreri MCA 2997]